MIANRTRNSHRDPAVRVFGASVPLMFPPAEYMGGNTGVQALDYLINLFAASPEIAAAIPTLAQANSSAMATVASGWANAIQAGDQVVVSGDNVPTIADIMVLEEAVKAEATPELMTPAEASSFRPKDLNLSGETAPDIKDLMPVEPVAEEVVASSELDQKVQAIREQHADREQDLGLEQAAKDMYGVTTSPLDAGYIFSDGAMLDLGRSVGHGRGATMHNEVGTALGVDGNSYEAMMAFAWNTEALRVTVVGQGNNELNVQIHAPITNAQRDAILSIAETIDAKKLFFDVTAQDGSIVAYGMANMSDFPAVIDHVKALYDGGDIYREAFAPETERGISIPTVRTPGANSTEAGSTTPVEVADFRSLGLPENRSTAVAELSFSGAETARSVLEERLSGAALENALDIAQELRNRGCSITPDGNAILYHRTSVSSASTIMNRQAMVGSEDGLFFSTTPFGQAEGYGETVVRVEIPIENLSLDDIFDGEAHVRVPATTGELTSVVATESYVPTADISAAYNAIMEIRANAIENGSQIEIVSIDKLLRDLMHYGIGEMFAAQVGHTSAISTHGDESSLGKLAEIGQRVVGEKWAGESGLVYEEPADIANVGNLPEGYETNPREFVDNLYADTEEYNNIYHVTTANDLVLSEGLKPRSEIGAIGLGGGIDDISPNKVSTTYSEKHAKDIEETIIMASRAARGEITIGDVLDFYIGVDTAPGNEPNPYMTAALLNAPDANTYEDIDALKSWAEQEYSGDPWALLKYIDNAYIDLFVGGKQIPGVEPYRVGITASREQMALIDPSQVSTLTIGVRSGAQVEQDQNEAEMRFNAEDVWVVSREISGEEEFRIAVTTLRDQLIEAGNPNESRLGSLLATMDQYGFGKDVAVQFSHMEETLLNAGIDTSFAAIGERALGDVWTNENSAASQIAAREAAAATVAPEQATKQPWEMTSSEIGSSTFTIPLSSIEPILDQGVIEYSSRTDGPIEVMPTGDGKYKVLDGNHRYYEALGRGDTEIEATFHKSELQYHEQNVKAAIERGEAVPPEVLAEYPGLQGQAVAANGETISLYHGTGSDLYDLSAFVGGDLGLHLGTLEQAGARNPSTVIQVEVRMNNPLRMRDVLHWGSDAIDELLAMGTITEAEYKDLLDSYWGNNYELDESLPSNLAKIKETYQRTEAVRVLLESKGYDGIVYANEVEGEGDSYIVFRPEQITSQSPVDGDVAKQPWAMTKAEYETLPENKPHEVIYLNIGSWQLEVIQNPTYREISQMMDEERERQRGLGTSNFGVSPLIRFTQDANGNRYAWKAALAVHYDVEAPLSRLVGEELSQNAGQTPYRNVIRKAIIDGENVSREIAESAGVLDEWEAANKPLSSAYIGIEQWTGPGRDPAYRVFGVASSQEARV